MSSKALRRFYGDLLSLGFSSYWEYLKSPLWYKIRLKVLTIHNHQCLLCPMMATQVHHLSYSKAVLEGKNLRKLVPLCRGCHESIEISSRNKKRTIGQARMVFNRRWKKLPPWVKRGFYKRLRSKQCK